MSYQVKNFTQRDTLNVEAACYKNIPLIRVIADCGSLRLQHDLTPEQAREMAKFLIASALEAEMMVEEVVA